MRVWSGLFFLSCLAACSGTQSSFNAPVTNLAHTLQVYNGTTMAFYNSSYALVTTLSTNYGTSAPLVSSRSLATAFLGGSCAAATCDQITFIDQANRKFKFNTETLSQTSITSSTAASGVAVSSTNNEVYVIDSTNLLLTYLRATTGNYLMGSFAASTFDVATLAAASSVSGVGTANQKVAVSDSTQLKAHIFAANTGAFVSSVDLSGLCAGGTLGEMESSSDLDLVFINCVLGGTDAVLKLTLSGAPVAGGPYAWSHGGNTLATVTGMEGNTLANRLIAVGGTKVISLNPSSGVTDASIDLSSCDPTITLSDIAYDHTRNFIYVSDSTNSMIYILDGTTLTLKYSTCADSKFSVAADVPTPTRLSFY